MSVNLFTLESFINALFPKPEFYGKEEIYYVHNGDLIYI